MTDERTLPSPGKARTRRRRRRQLLFLGIAGVIGGVLGGVVAGSDTGGSDLFSGNYAELAIEPRLAIVLALGFFFALVLLPLWGFTQIDELQREQNFIGFTGGCLAFLGAFPMWAMLHAGGHSGPPDAFGLFGIGFAGLMLSFLYAKFRS